MAKTVYSMSFEMGEIQQYNLFRASYSEAVVSTDPEREESVRWVLDAPEVNKMMGMPVVYRDRQWNLKILQIQQRCSSQPFDTG